MTQTWVVLNDTQIPFHDRRVLDKVVLPFIRDLQPHGVVLNGDVVDCYAISDYDKNPLTFATLNREIYEGEKLMDSLKWIKEKWWLGGNHEDRLRRYIWKRAKEFGGLSALAFPNLFNLGAYGFSWKPYGGYVMLGKLLVTHGSMVRGVSGATARAHFDRYGTSLLVGHTHRLGAFYRTNVRGSHVAYENGCLCLLTPEYAQAPDWQQGFSVVHVDPKSGFFNVQQLPILKHRMVMYGGQTWGV